MDNKFVLSQSFNDIVFEKRNKKYGAYQIRRTYGRYALVAGACAIFFFTCGSITWAYVATPDDGPRIVIREVDISEVRDYGDKDLPKEEVPIKKEEIQSPPDKGAVTHEQTEKLDIVDEAETTPPDNLETGKTPNGVVGGTGTPTGGDCLDCPKVDTTQLPPSLPVVWSPWPPTCDGLDPYLTKNVRYPDICREQGIEGIVYVEFIVDTKGNYRDVKIAKGAHPAFNKEALRVMGAMPKWTPAKDANGELVEYIMRKPIRFELSN